MRSSRLLRGTGREEEYCFVWRKKNRARLSGDPAWSTGKSTVCWLLMLTEIMFTRLEERSRDVTIGLWELSVPGRSHLLCRYERERGRHQLRSKYKNPTENSILFMSVAPSPQTAGCDIMMGLWLQFEYSIWSFLSTGGFALQITTRSQKCLNYRDDRTAD